MAAAGGCAMASHHGLLSDERLGSLVASAGVQSPWRIEQEQLRDDDESDWFVYAYEEPKDIYPAICATRVHGFGVRGRRSDPEIVRHQEEWQLAFCKCEGATLEDFRPVTGEASEQELSELIGLIRASIPVLGGSPGLLRFQAADLPTFFEKIVLENVVSIVRTAASGVTITISARELAPELLGVQISPREGGAPDVFVFRASGPHPLM